MVKSDFYDKIIKSIENKKQEIFDVGDTIFSHPETGFREVHTSALVERKLNDLGLSVETFGNIPGAKTVIDTGRPGPNIALISELDAITCPQHPQCDPSTGAAHACGHHIQVADMIGAATGLIDSGVLNHLKGKIHLLAVPSEEVIDTEYKNSLRKHGVIRYTSGKQELLYRGIFDSIQMCLALHSRAGKFSIYRPSSFNGSRISRIRFIGKATHAGDVPYEGINALNAANLALDALHCLRETFRDEDHVRINPILIHGGEINSAIPAETVMECHIRARSHEALADAVSKAKRAYLSGAYAVGAKVEIEYLLNVLPLKPDSDFEKLAGMVMEKIAVPELIGSKEHRASGTDLGDLSALMPVLQPYIGGVEGALHSKDFKITDRNTAYLLGSRYLALMAAELLWASDTIAEDIIAGYEPLFADKKAYFEFVDGCNQKESYDFSKPAAVLPC